MQRDLFYIFLRNTLMNINYTWAFHFVDAPFIVGFIKIAVLIQIC